MTADELKWKPVGEKTRGIASLRGKIVPIIGKCIGIMGGRIQFAPTLIRETLLILIQTSLITGNMTWKPVGEKTQSIASLKGKIVPTIGKCIGIMGGRIQFDPTIIPEILLILIQTSLFTGNMTWKPIVKKTQSIALLKG